MVKGSTIIPIRISLGRINCRQLTGFESHIGTADLNSPLNRRDSSSQDLSSQDRASLDQTGLDETSKEKRRKTDQPPGSGGPEDVAKYRRAWRSYVARRNLVVVLFLSFVPLGALIAKLKLGEPIDLAILVAWVCVYLAGGWWLTELKCPRCGKIFAYRLWTERCISCDLSKNEVAAVARGK